MCVLTELISALIITLIHPLTGDAEACKFDEWLLLSKSRLRFLGPENPKRAARNSSSNKRNIHKAFNLTFRRALNTKGMFLMKEKLVKRERRLSKQFFV